MKIGIFGGSFNPIHNGHLILAECVRDTLGLQKVIFIPNGEPPHKDGSDLAGPDHRAAMVRSSVMLNPRFDFSDIELKREGTSYTIDTVRELLRRRQADQLYFIIGADSIPELPTWVEIEELGKLCRFVVGARPGFSMDKLETLEGKLPAEFIQNLKDNFIEMPLIDISASDIRQRVREGKSIRHLVPNEVLDYVRTNDLYRET